MINFTVYSKKTGKIIRNGNCHSDDINLQNEQDFDVIEGLYQDDKYYWDGEFKLIPDSPGEYYYFDYDLKEWVADLALAKANVISKRNNELGDSDWTQLPDSPLPDEVKKEWAIYRQELRDITKQENFPLSVNFPKKPMYNI